MLGRRLLSQAHQVQSFILSLLDVQESEQPRGLRTDLVRDEFGLHKMIVVATAPGKVRNGASLIVNEPENLVLTSLAVMCPRALVRNLNSLPSRYFPYHLVC